MKHTIKWGNLVEGAKVQMEVFTRSAKKAASTLREAVRFSMLTPFRPGEVFGATATAMQYGIKDPYKKGAYGLPGGKTAMDLLAGLASFRNAQGEAIGLNRAVYAIARGERRMLRAYGVDVQQAHERSIEKGKAGSWAYVSSMLEQLGKMPQVMNMAKAHSESMAGMWSTIAGFAEEFWRNVSGAAEGYMELL